MTDKFDKWYEGNYIEGEGPYCGAKGVWDYKQEQLETLIKRIENYPCCMSCYVTIEEMNAGKNMKEVILRILKGEV